MLLNLDKNIIKQDWILLQEKETPFVVVDNWYTKNELKLLWKELDFFTQKNILERSENSIYVARPDGKNAVGHNYRIYLDQYFTEKGRAFDCIGNFLFYKIQNDTFFNLLVNCSQQFRTFRGTNSNSNFVSYYENKDKYDFHNDTMMFSMLIWVYKTPKKFKGGDLFFENNKKVECKNNRMIIFPSYLRHKVDEINMKVSKKNNGRYTITHFFTYAPR